MQRKRPSFGPVIFYAIAGTFGVYLTFSAVQGEYGLFRRIQIDADAAQLRAERDRLATELVVLENNKQRLSDAYLDLDLLDQQVRDVLGYVRAEDIVLR